jgi:hypothetical protein
VAEGECAVERRELAGRVGGWVGSQPTQQQQSTGTQWPARSKQLLVLLKAWVGNPHTQRLTTAEHRYSVAGKEETWKERRGISRFSRL